MVYDGVGGYELFELVFVVVFYVWCYGFVFGEVV